MTNRTAIHYRILRPFAAFFVVFALTTGTAIGDGYVPEPNVCLESAHPRSRVWYTCINRPWWVDIEAYDDDTWVNGDNVPSPHDILSNICLVGPGTHNGWDFQHLCLNTDMDCDGDEVPEQGVKICCEGNPETHTVVCRGRITLPPFSQPSISQIRLRGIDAALRSNDGDGPLFPAPDSEPYEELMYGPESENLCGEDGAYFEKTFTVFKVTLTIDSGMPGDDCDNWICVNDNVNVGTKATVTANMEPDVPARISLVLNGPVRFDDGAPTSPANGESTTIVGVWPGDFVDPDPEDYQFTVAPYWETYWPCGEPVEGSVFKIEEQYDFTYAYTYAVRDYERPCPSRS